VGGEEFQKLSFFKKIRMDPMTLERFSIGEEKPDVLKQGSSIAFSQLLNTQATFIFWEANVIPRYFGTASAKRGALPQKLS